ncbi:O-acetyl-ADP-ribose deacetylase (regulator of RNase III), contains Macro domain [Methylobacterium sp. 275MFSha3.1]|uniref:type II toxin-antitoxin system antitoxin DNA ADP-ribosyl glycohydrolase DarG n=1 Tax=Methylobacterium sp. 275MFSha3.1 TaxID=1502746 RepID=UPI0008A79F76|nr:macro domain-containing protein [Methylobacterium sp. 275MFSha3.1]SEH34305.1 O-acetyl-ADP-ribose deacetylase (regulator of RNase III), contains Macro domain [Methylobacterium sp. 275MFSha3.1]
MIEFTQGNLLEARVEALVNTVNTVGVMGKGIALMFKEAYPENTREYELACKAGEVQVGRMFVTERTDLVGPRWIVNFPTKRHWRNPSKIEWIDEGLEDLKRFLIANTVRSIALPPLGSGNGGLDWSDVRPKIEAAFRDLPDINVIVYEPTSKYMAVAKREGVQKLTPARALIADLIRRYSVLGFECTMLEIHKLAYMFERQLEVRGVDNPLELGFAANRYGPYAERLRHLLNGLDGSYLQSDKRLGDATPLDTISFDFERREYVATYLQNYAKEYLPVLDAITDLIDGFESPFGMELLATVDWLLHREGADPRVDSIRAGLRAWPGGSKAAERKMRIFDDRMIGLALERLTSQAASA